MTWGAGLAGITIGGTLLSSILERKRLRKQRRLEEAKKRKRDALTARLVYGVGGGGKVGSSRRLEYTVPSFDSPESRLLAYAQGAFNAYTARERLNPVAARRDAIRITRAAYTDIHRKYGTVDVLRDRIRTDASEGKLERGPDPFVPPPREGEPPEVMLPDDFYFNPPSSGPRTVRP